MEENSSFQPSKIRIFKKRISRGFLILILLILAGIAVYFYSQYQNTKTLLQNPNQASSEETKTLLTQVGKLIELPTGESPTIATVSDKTKLLDQPFFAKAENGDKVLIYSNAKKAILYRPSINKIIEVAPVNMGSNNQTNPNPSGAVALPSSAVSPILTPTPTIVKKSVSPTLTPTITPGQ